jgi:hypothetical protein
MKPRVGSKIDCESLVSVFEQCHFNVVMHVNQSLEVSMKRGTRVFLCFCCDKIERDLACQLNEASVSSSSKL